MLWVLMVCGTFGCQDVASFRTQADCAQYRATLTTTAVRPEPLALLCVRVS